MSRATLAVDRVLGALTALLLRLVTDPGLSTTTAVWLAGRSPR